MYNLVTPMERPTEEWFRVVVDKLNLKTENDYRTYLRRLQKLPNQVNIQSDIFCAFLIILYLFIIKLCYIAYIIQNNST